MSVQLKIFKIPQPEPKELPIIRLEGHSDFPFANDFEEDNGFLKDSMNLNELVSGGQDMTFYAKVTAQYQNSPYREGDVLVVNRSWPLQNDKLVVCCVEEEFVLKRLRFYNEKLWLESLNKKEEPLLLTNENQLLVWGVVTHELRKLW